MKRVTVHAAKTHLSRLLKAAEAGEEVVITRGRTPVARLVPITDRPIERKFGAMKGRFTVDDSFWEPMTAEELAVWYEGPL